MAPINCGLGYDVNGWGASSEQEDIAGYFASLLPFVSQQVPPHLRGFVAQALQRSKPPPTLSPPSVQRPDLPLRPCLLLAAYGLYLARPSVRRHMAFQTTPTVSENSHPSAPTRPSHITLQLHSTQLPDTYTATLPPSTPSHHTRAHLSTDAPAAYPTLPLTDRNGVVLDAATDRPADRSTDRPQRWETHTTTTPRRWPA
jgi:hypothetical protein